MDPSKTSRSERPAKIQQGSLWAFAWAWLWFPWVRWMIKSWGFKQTCHRLNLEPIAGNQKESPTLNPDVLRVAESMEKAVRRAGRYWPDKRRNCLIRSIIACRMVRKKGIPCNIRLGIRTDQASNSEVAHAWIEIAGNPIGESEQSMATLAQLHSISPSE